MEAADDGPNIVVPSTLVENQDGVHRSWIGLGPDLEIVGIWEADQSLKISFSFFFSLSFSSSLPPFFSLSFSSFSVLQIKNMKVIFKNELCQEPWSDFP